MKKYFVKNGRLDGECVVDTPANPENLEIVEVSEVLTAASLDYVYQNGQVVYSPIMKSAEQLLAEQKSVAKQYLANTDWYFARKQETGQDVPEEVLTKRAEARALLQ